ncbi:MAG: Jag N-terminal domain-containing protein, partial [Ktedonobacteraceae bacterium]|nr:Jag N-terminal domain-containing protein [Ktedonobacteraceae bacterium]
METVESIEASGKSVEEAITQALARLGKRRDEVDIAVLQEPSRGTFGLGSRDARVRVTTRATVPGASISGAIITPEMADAMLGPGGIEVPLPEEEEEIYDDEEDEEEYLDEDEEYEDEDELENEEEEPTPFITSTDLPLQPLLEQTEGAVAGNDLQDVEHPSREDVEITVDVLQHILRYMNIHATVQVRSTSPLTLNIRGINENLGLLIGRRGETLASLQLLVNLIVSHRTKHRMRIIVDAENYRERREENLRSLA